MNESTLDPAILAAGRDRAGGFQERSGTSSGVSWEAIIAGAVGAAALSLILLMLGVGLGLSTASPWAKNGADAGTIGVSTVLWLTFTQLTASGMGGYLAGRLRTRWAGVHTDEVYFRDTAHGFFAWALATLVTAATLTTAIGSIVGGAAHTGAAVVGGAVPAAASMAPAIASRSDNARPDSGYFVDSLFRKDATITAGASSSGTAAADDGGRSTAEAGRIFANAMSSGSLTPDDTKYLGQMVAQRTGIAQPDADKRVVDTFNKAQTKAKDAQAAAEDAADKARKASAYAALWLFVSLLVGAFTASFAATFGGRRRDLH